ncbi:hypothetical protein JYK02_32095 [Corallococcus macrosporus]|uniref:CARDB domain-containing protein n=1 Tax=Corallococcus macrosporus TaxID=35 RepID=A0ABS3DLH4_9BACT|nr:hypothetical protein [Corallococcus macrosporus]MBN8232168.1 hypothetical protein [Corallococcus macrosporus]
MAAVLAVSLFAARPASAQVHINTITAPNTITDPLAPFTITYTLFGSSYMASANVSFYLATTSTQSSGRVLLASSQIYLGSGSGLHYPPSGPQTRQFYPASFQAAARSQFNAIMAACQPQTWYIQAEVDYTNTRGDDTLIGTYKQPDFYFTAGTLSPSTIQPGGTTSFSFDLYTRCPAASPSTVGVFLADANQQPLSYIGGISIGAGAGTFSLPPTSITFSPSIPPGPYSLVLIADVNEGIAESNEDNNGGAFALDIVPYAMAAFDRDESPLTLEVPIPTEAASMRNAPGGNLADNYVQKSWAD